MTEAIFLFPGQGGQRVGMGRDLVTAHPAAKAVFDAADAALDAPITPVIFEGPEEALTRTPNAQPAVTAVNLAILAVLREKGVSPIAAAGHSLGELSADCAAGVFDFETALRLTRRRGELMQACADASPGSMVAVIGLPMETVEALCRTEAEQSGGAVQVANFNSPEQVVITGAAAPVARVAEAAEGAGAKRTVALKVSGPWHSPLMAEAQARFAEVLAETEFAAPRLPVYANVDAKRLESAAAVREALTRQVTGAVRWTQLILQLRTDFPDAPFVECGPGRVLKGLLRRIDRGATCHAVECSKSLAATVEALGA